jgi:hypothetical protein
MVQKNILRFQVSVHNADFVDIFDPGDDLLVIFAGLFFFEEL